MPWDFAMWTTENRARYDRGKPRYPSNLTDAEWALVAPLIPPAKRGGNKHTANLRDVADGLFHVLSTGCQWRAILGGRSPRTWHHAARFSATSRAGSGTAPWSASTTRFTSSAVSGPGERPSRSDPPEARTAEPSPRQQASSLARA